METLQGGSVCASYRVTLRCKYLGNTGRIRVQRYESAVHGRDSQTIHIGWDHELDIRENYIRAVAEYVNRAGWTGQWVVSLVTDGAVAVCLEAVEMKGDK